MATADTDRIYDGVSLSIPYQGDLTWKLLHDSIPNLKDYSITNFQTKNGDLIITLGINGLPKRKICIRSTGMKFFEAKMAFGNFLQELRA